MTAKPQAVPVPKLAQPPCEASLMGVVQGALAHFGINLTEPQAFALAGHAFAINVREDLCPSGPYCWNHERFHALLADNVGVRMSPVGGAQVDAAAKVKLAAEQRLHHALDEGAVCSMLHLDHQLVLGRDADGFLLAQPWGDIEPTPAHLTFGSWEECAGKPPVAFFQWTKADRPQRRLRPALDFAIEAWHEPERFADAPYGFGPNAYANWPAALDAGHGNDHGAWWNGRVWAECRAQAGDYFAELAATGEESDIPNAHAATLAQEYRGIAQRLRFAADREQPIAERRRAVAEARDAEAHCVDLIAALR